MIGKFLGPMLAFSVRSGCSTYWYGGLIDSLIDGTKIDMNFYFAKAVASSHIHGFTRVGIKENTVY